MVLKAKMVAEAGMDCREIEYATVSRMFGRNYELMFTDAWGFELADRIELAHSDYTAEELREKFSDTIGNRLSAGNIELEKNLRKYHGIDVQKNSLKDKATAFDSMKEQIDQGKPIGMWVDQHFLDWTKEIRKNGPLRYYGTLMIHGYDDQEKVFYCIDIHGRIEGVKWSYDNFAAFLDSIEVFEYDTFQVIGDEYIPEMNEFLQHTINRVLGRTKEHPNIFEQMQILAEYVSTSLDMQKEIQVSQGPLTMPDTPNHIYFIRAFIRISRMRNMFALAVEYYGKKYQNKKLLEISSQFRLFNGNWKQILAILTKAYFSSNYKGIREKIHDDILKFEQEEKAMLEQLTQMCSDSSENDASNVRTNETYTNAAGYQYGLVEKSTDYQHVTYDLHAFFNNKAIAENVNDRKNADFDGIGNCYLWKTDNIWQNPNWEGKVPFTIERNAVQMDNVLCNGQLITLENQVFDCVSLVGACDSGPFFGVMEVTYADETRDKISFGFDEWRFKMCEFQEEPLYECDRYYHGNVSHEERGYLFVKTLELNGQKQIRTIKLPACTNMHLFAMTFSKKKGQ